MGHLLSSVPETAAYDQCVFAVAQGLNAKHGHEATYRAAEFAEQARSEGDFFGICFWRDVMRAIEAVDSTSTVSPLN